MKIEQFMSELIYKEEAFELIGICMDIHNEPGHGFSEIVYKDAPELELSSKRIAFEREKPYTIIYKGIPLDHIFYAGFVVFNKIILEIKCAGIIANEHVSQTINYLKASENKPGIIINFPKEKLEYKRIVY